MQQTVDMYSSPLLQGEVFKGAKTQQSTDGELAVKSSRHRMRPIVSVIEQYQLTQTEPRWTSQLDSSELNKSRREIGTN